MEEIITITIEYTAGTDVSEIASDLEHLISDKYPNINKPVIIVCDDTNSHGAYAVAKEYGRSSIIIKQLPRKKAYASSDASKYVMVYADGYNAAIGNKPRDSNPYLDKAMGEQNRQWLLGFNNAIKQKALFPYTNNSKPTPKREHPTFLSKTDWDTRQGTHWQEEIASKCDHKWQPVSFRFETQLLDPKGRVEIRQPDLIDGRVYCVCMQCLSHSYVVTGWVGHFIGSPDLLEQEKEDE